MKPVLITLFLLTTHFSYAQCIECTSLKEAFVQPEKVRSITYNGFLNEPLDSLPASIGLFKNIRELYLSDNRFTSIPKEIGELKELKSLSFAACKLTALPEELFTLPKLKELFINDNSFSEKYIAALKLKFAKQMPRTKVFFE